MEELTAYCSRYGFLFQGSGLYGGLANTWDYGPLGTRLKNQVKDAWRKFTFRTVEFEQMEYQIFCRKGDDERLYEEFKELGMRFFESLGICSGHLRFCDHEKLAHYAKAACDIEYLFPFGWGEINGTHNRTDFDLPRHQQHSGKSIPYVVEWKRRRSCMRSWQRRI